MMTTDQVGIYVHIPYCVRKCNYCDFCSVASSGSMVPDTYIDRLISEIYEYRCFDKISASTLYFGGGTPSLLSVEQLEKIVSAIKEVFDLENNAEFSIEANPGTLDISKLIGYRNLGVNRLSLGVQSFNDDELSYLGRIHDKKIAIHSFKIAREAGIDNISIDLIYGIPLQTQFSFKSTLDEALSLSPDHISVYGLIVEEGTPFHYNIADLPLPSEDDECDMYYLASSLLYANGYEHYEISNYSKPGKRSKHNLKYWNSEDYIGLGASACSFFRGRRYTNSDKISEYLMSNGIGYFSEGALSKNDRMFEYAMMNLRLSDGISPYKYRSRFGVDFNEGREELINKFTSLGLMEETENSIKLTERGFYVSNYILSELL